MEIHPLNLDSIPSQMLYVKGKNEQFFIEKSVKNLLKIIVSGL